MTLSLERRLALIDWARTNNAWIVEDDYDSESRYDGRPIAAIQGLDPTAPVLYNQIVLSEFMREGHFTTHIRRMRQLYSARRDAFHESFKKHLACFGTCIKASGGLHATVQLHRHVREPLTTTAARKCDIELPTLRRLWLDRSKKDGWLMGFAALAPGEAARAMAALAQAIKREMKGDPG